VSEPSDPEDLARRCAQAMWADDSASRGLGMHLESVSPGRARVEMTVIESMVNGHGICHGGFVAALADSTFAFACNTYDEVTVAAGFDIVFVSAAHLGDALVAEAVERVRRGRSGVYDVTVRRVRALDASSTGAPGDAALGATVDAAVRAAAAVADVVAEFRGRSRSLGRPILPI